MQAISALPFPVRRSCILYTESVISYNLLIMRTFARRLLLMTIVLGLVPALHAADSAALLRRDLAKIFSDQRFSDAQWGVKIISLDRSEVIFEKNPRRLYIPASNVKIITAAAALLRLGPEYRFKTQALTDGAIVPGVLQGNLIIAGFGDPSSSSRIGTKDPFETFRNWAHRLKTQGVRKISGDLIGDGSAFEALPYGRGWAWDDLAEGYAAPVSALQFNENLLTLEIRPGPQVGSPAQWRMEPLPEYVTIDSRVATRAARHPSSIQVIPTRFDETVRIRGALALHSPGIIQSVAVQLPTRYYLSALKQILRQEGIDVSACALKESGGIGEGARNPLWTHWSPPLSELLPSAMKLSLNLMSETLVRTLGLEFRGEGTTEKGKEVVEQSLTAMGIPREGYAYVDASGLSRLNLTTAEMLVRVLAGMYRHPYFPNFHSALSIAGVDGTLKNRMAGTRAENNVHAKTGTLSNVSAISGYVQSAEGELLAFSIIANNFLVSRSVAEQLQDRALERLARFSRTKPSAVKNRTASSKP